MKKQSIINELEMHYSKYYEGLGIRVIYETMSYPHNASAHYNVIKKTVTVNLTDAALRKYDSVHYMVAMAHELGHAYDYQQRGVTSTYMGIAKAIIKRDVHSYTMDAEYSAYTYGINYIPYRYKHQYHSKNKAYINKLSQVGA